MSPLPEGWQTGRRHSAVQSRSRINFPRGLLQVPKIAPFTRLLVSRCMQKSPGRSRGIEGRCISMTGDELSLNVRLLTCLILLPVQDRLGIAFDVVSKVIAPGHVRGPD